MAGEVGEQHSRSRHGEERRSREASAWSGGEGRDAGSTDSGTGGPLLRAVGAGV
jgi:hypothetical protein